MAKTIVEIRLYIAESLIYWGFHLMPSKHPDSYIWARHIMAATEELTEKFQKKK
jgi:hypothetical protein